VSARTFACHQGEGRIRTRQERSMKGRKREEEMGEGRE